MPLSLNDYQQLALRTAGNHGDFERTLIYTTLGLNGEAGEVAELVKKAFFHGHELPREKLKHELGDVLWYVAVLAQAMGWSLEDVAQENIAKLARRYPEGFSGERSRHRTE
ncbi:MAG: nucleoside triphosphate pyrophosphohydrolase family protein [Caldilineales bacterium]|nr:nucleoside triphosphate pyrophosphohydrolase family protein [Caldilineales bacterium]MCX7851902.1 nucleoside triphosphate pyrophosphohydrolase family protein [Caldilineales bacterium]